MKLDIAALEDAVVEFADELLANEESFTFEQADKLATQHKLSTAAPVIKMLKELGCKMAPREPERRVRGFTTSSHDRYYGPGACRSHGGSGWEQINGFAGDAV